MTLKSIIKTISNDKILSILALFSVILIGTLMYYNLNEGLLNYNSRTLEYFYDNNDDPCSEVRELINDPDEFETYSIIYNNPENDPEIENTTYIISKTLKYEQIMNYMKYHIEANVNELNQTFPIDTFSCANKEFSTIKTIITKFMSNYSSDILEGIIDRSQTYFENAKKEYEADIQKNDNGETTGQSTQLHLYRYLTKIYKILLNIIISAKFEKKLKRLKGTDTSNGLIQKYTGDPVTWRKRQIRNVVNSLYRIYIPLMFINQNEINFKSVINYNLLPESTSLYSGSRETTDIHWDNNANNDTSLPDINVLEYNFNNDVPLSEYIVDNNTIFEEMINKANLMGSLKEIYDTTTFGYYHVFEYSQSIIKTYATAVYGDCLKTIDYENSLCSTCLEESGNVTCAGAGGFCNTCPADENTERPGTGNFSCEDIDGNEYVCDYLGDKKFFERKGCQYQTANTTTTTTTTTTTNTT